jgi:sugar/nucleoside kinase (ribokinase family)
MPAGGRTIATVGGLVVDMIICLPELPLRPLEHQAGEMFAIEPGGLGNVLIMASRLGMRASALGWSGADFYGDQILEILVREGIDTTGVQRPAAPSRICLVLVDAEGRHVFVGVSGGPGPERIPDAWRPVLTTTSWILGDGYALGANPRVMLDAFALAHDAGNATIVFDPGPLAHRADAPAVSEMLRRSSIVLLTEEEAAELVGRDTPAAMAQSLRALGPHLVCIKRGADGVLVATPEKVFSEPAFPVQLRDASGAGDAFAAAFVAGLAHGLTVRRAAILANAVGALTASKLGTGTRLPTRDEVVSFLAAHGMEADELLPRVPHR